MMFLSHQPQFLAQDVFATFTVHHADKGDFLELPLT